MSRGGHYSCTEEESVDISECLNRYFARKYGCRVPWDKNKDKGHVCGETKDFKGILGDMVTMMYKGESEIASIAGCRAACQRFHRCGICCYCD